MVQDLVHPSMYPLVYGRSLVLREELVGVTDAIENWSGKGDVIEKDTWERSSQDRFRYNVGGSEVPPDFWSNTYQWLPSNVAFQEDGKVKFISYINNLHPVKYAELYRTIEELINTSLPMWDQCLAVVHDHREIQGAGRTECRMGYPDVPDDDNEENWIPSNPEECAHMEVNWEEPQDVEYLSEEENETEKKWEIFRKPRIPEVPFEQMNYAPPDDKKLFNKFKASGLQIIVKLASIELSPENPDFPTGGWHVEGQMNEHIAGTALYYLDSENVTSSHLSFRMQTDAYLSTELEVGQDQYSYLSHIYGTELGHGAPCLQNYGSVKTHQGRLIAFPNVFQHRVSPFSLVDKTKPGHRRFIALWLVDPHQRIISTANVPPQQKNWWRESIFGGSKEKQAEAISKMPAEIVELMKERLSGDGTAMAMPGKLPVELMQMVHEHFHAEKHTLPMNLEEAKEHRLKLMEERGAFVQTAKASWHNHSYNFCEH
jgi:hypothetical protein